MKDTIRDNKGLKNTGREKAILVKDDNNRATKIKVNKRYSEVNCK